MRMLNLMDTPSGAELRQHREEAGVLAYELAMSMGVASSRVSQIEALARVTPRTAKRYRAALALSQVAKTSKAVANAG